MVIEDLRKPTCEYVYVDDLLKGRVYEDPEGDVIFITDEGNAVMLDSGMQWRLDYKYDDESKFKPLKAKLVIEHE